MSLSRFRRRIVAAASLIVALAVGLATPASAGTGPSSAPHLAKTDVAYGQLGFDDLDTDLDPIRLTCGAQSSDAGPAAACGWTTESTAVESFQLWRIELRVDDAARTLIAEVDADAEGAVDTTVTAPAAYLYAVLGVDGDGEVVARSRVDRVRFRDPSIEHLRLDCDKASDETDATDTEAGSSASIGCSWSAAETVDVRAYRLYRGVHGGDTVLVATLGADATAFVDTGVEAGVRYLYRVEGVDETGETVARSRLDGAGCPKPERDAERDRTDARDRNEGRDRDEARDLSDERTRARDGSERSGADDGSSAEIVETVVEPDDQTVEAEASVGDRHGDRRPETTGDRDDAETRPDRDHRDRRERGR